MTVHVVIERLTVEGSSQADAVRIGDALRARLTELAASGFAPKAAHVDRLDAGELPRAASPEHVGCHTAGQIFQSMKGASHA